MPTDMNVYPCGTLVYVRNVSVECCITAIEIRYELVRYECTYYTDSVQQRIWVHASELMDSKKKIRLGFKNE
jgi:hypothetical protein